MFDKDQSHKLEYHVDRLDGDVKMAQRKHSQFRNHAAGI